MSHFFRGWKLYSEGRDSEQSRYAWQLCIHFCVCHWTCDLMLNKSAHPVHLNKQNFAISFQVGVLQNVNISEPLGNDKFTNNDQMGHSVAF